MDLEARKYNFIQKLFAVDKENIMDDLERVLKHQKEEYQMDTATKKELDNRLENYKNNPDDVLNWKDVKSDW